jgi:hypothetical protein
MGPGPVATHDLKPMPHTEYAVVMWAVGCQELVDSFSTYAAAAHCATDCNSWAETQAGDYFFTVETSSPEAAPLRALHLESGPVLLGPR